MWIRMSSWIGWVRIGPCEENLCDFDCRNLSLHVLSITIEKRGLLRLKNIVRSTQMRETVAMRA
jgi:hypothetical protein